MDTLRYFTKNDYQKTGLELLIPESSDFNKLFSELVIVELREVYIKNPNFIKAIPSSHREEWSKVGALNLIFDDLKTRDDSMKSVFEWEIRLSDSQLKKTFVREAYYLSPEYLGMDKESASNDKNFRRIYMREYGRMINSIISYPEFKKEEDKYKNPEVLIPFSVPFSHMEIVRRIDLVK
ncbi:MAG: hypothetical protein Q8O89_03120 [Nanoarchaeota archaeon]|nr:hypothetical protein [Nanoarchaeota archaeon]